MTDLTEQEHSQQTSPSFMGFPFLPVPRLAERFPDGEKRKRGWLVALRCRMHRSAIDRELADGADPDASDCRHLRAAQLTSRSNREALASAYERLLKAATSFPQLEIVPVNWRAIRKATPRLTHLAARLRQDRSVRVHGVARATLLLNDPEGPLYAKEDSRLVDEVRSTLALL